MHQFLQLTSHRLRGLQEDDNKAIELINNLHEFLKGHTHLVHLCCQATDRRVTAVASRPVASQPIVGYISNMLDISRQTPRRPTHPVAHGRLVAQLIGHINRVIGNRICDRIGRLCPILASITQKSPSEYGP